MNSTVILESGYFFQKKKTGSRDKREKSKTNNYVTNLGKFIFNSFYKYDASKKCMNMISYVLIKGIHRQVIMNIKLVLTGKARHVEFLK